MRANIARLGTVLAGALLVVALTLGYWQIWRAAELSARPDNPRRLEAAARVLRGRILDRAGRPLAWSEQTSDGVRRSYDSAAVAPVTGYFSPRYGASGLEAAYDRQLGGQASSDLPERLWSELAHANPVGSDLRLGLDLTIQRAAFDALDGAPGAVVAIDPRDGAVLALVSQPTFDPNRLETDWSDLVDRADRPLFNRAVQATYPPGSTFKVLLAAAAADLGVVDLDQKYRCTRPIQIGDLAPNCQNHSHLASIDYYQALGWSCNRTFALTALGLGYSGPLQLGDSPERPYPWETGGLEPSVRRLEEYAGRFGFGTPIPFDLAVEPSRLVNEGQRFFPSLLAQTGFGQGQVAATPLQMALVAATIARHGEVPRPYLVSEIRSPHGSTSPGRQRGPALGRAVSARAAAAVERGLRISVEQAYGRKARLPGVAVAGKTGTAETGAGPPDAWFIAYAPVEEPRVAVAVVLEHGGSGADFAAPAAQKVLAAALAAERR